MKSSNIFYAELFFSNLFQNSNLLCTLFFPAYNFIFTWIMLFFISFQIFQNFIVSLNIYSVSPIAGKSHVFRSTIFFLKRLSVDHTVFTLKLSNKCQLLLNSYSKCSKTLFCVDKSIQNTRCYTPLINSIQNFWHSTIF